MTIPLRLEVYNGDVNQYVPAYKNLRFAKAWQGGEDVWLSFDLDRDVRIDYPDIAHGNDVKLRLGLNAIWAGEMRQIDQQEESITVNCLGRWVYADDINHGGQQRIWCDSRYKKWFEISNANLGGAAWLYSPQKYSMETNNHIYIAPRKNERFSAGAVYGAMAYMTDLGPAPKNTIIRVSFDYDIDLAWTTNWTLELLSFSTAANFVVEWDPGAGASGTGTKDITLVNVGGGANGIWFRMEVGGVGWINYTGNTGEDVYAEITNLRLWGQATESPCMIHVTEDIIDAIEATTPIDASHDLVQEQLFVRDTFTDNNGVLLANHQPDVDKLRGGWSLDGGGYDIQGNQANNTVAYSRAIINSGESDGVVCADPTTPAAGRYRTGIIFRRVDGANWWIWRIRSTGTAAELVRVGGSGTATVWTANLGIQPNYTYHLMVKLRGDEIQCYIGGILRTTWNDTDMITGTYHGLYTNDQTGLRLDNFEMYKALPIWPMFYEDGESCYAAMKDVASFGDWNHKAIGWGVEAGGDRLFLREADRETVRYVIPREYVAKMNVRGNTHREYLSEAWARYTDEEGIKRWTEKYYVHVTNDGLVVNTTATGDDLASVIYGVMKDKTVDFGRVDAELAVEYLIQHLQEHGHPQTKATYDVHGPVQDLHRGGAWIEPVELEMGYLVQMPFFRATEAEGVAGSDLRDADTTFLLVGMEHDHERGITRLIPEGATEDLARIIAYARAFQYEQDREHISKRSEVLGG